MNTNMRRRVEILPKRNPLIVPRKSAVHKKNRRAHRSEWLCSESSRDDREALWPAAGGRPALDSDGPPDELHFPGTVRFPIGTKDLVEPYAGSRSV